MNKNPFFIFGIFCFLTMPCFGMKKTIKGFRHNEVTGLLGQIKEKEDFLEKYGEILENLNVLLNCGIDQLPGVVEKLLDEVEMKNKDIEGVKKDFLELTLDNAKIKLNLESNEDKIRKVLKAFGIKECEDPFNELRKLAFAFKQAQLILKQIKEVSKVKNDMYVLSYLKTLMKNNDFFKKKLTKLTKLNEVVNRDKKPKRWYLSICYKMIGSILPSVVSGLILVIIIDSFFPIQTFYSYHPH